VKKPTMREFIGSITAWAVVPLVLAYAVSILGFRVVSVFILVIFVAPVVGVEIVKRFPRPLQNIITAMLGLLIAWGWVTVFLHGLATRGGGE